MITIEELRSTLEKIYNQAWGEHGSADQRDWFNHLYRGLQQRFPIGRFLYKGRIVWEDLTTEAVKEGVI